MDGMLSQDEINALLNGMSADDSADNETSETPQESNESASDNTPNTDKPEALSDTEKDAVGEISNISMGTAATTLSSLLNQKVNITTPRVEVEIGISFLESMTDLVLCFRLDIRKV